MVEETTAASHNLMKEAVSLIEAVSRFQVSQSAGSRFAQPRAAAANPRKAAPAPRPPAARSGPATAAARTAPQESANSWEEF
jgi:methyl-accepting chemotaxis protein